MHCSTHNEQNKCDTYHEYHISWLCQAARLIVLQSIIVTLGDSKPSEQGTALRLGAIEHQVYAFESDVGYPHLQWMMMMASKLFSSCTVC